MRKFCEYYDQIILEMPLTDIKKIGKWDDTKNRHGYDKQSVGILNSDSGWQKIQNIFNRVDNYDIRLYFVKLPNASKHVELGQVSTDDVEQKLGIRWGEDIPKPDNDDIVVIFTNNSAAEKVPLTAWTIAHRMGHAFYATFRKRYNDRSLDIYIKRIEKHLNEILQDGYGYNNTVTLNQNDPTMRNLIESLGNFRSARMKKLSRTFEFIFECFAQYLTSNGNLRFNEPPETILSSNKKAWGNPIGMNHRLKDKIAVEGHIQGLEIDMVDMFDYLLQSHVGTISIM